MDDSPRFCDHCGQPFAAGGAGTGQMTGHQACRTARALEPPRYCPRCGRRMVAKVTPTGWSSHCSQHGQTTTPT
jgi:NADH pyrophosphatase NudC (nudix superfamily)